MAGELTTWRPFRELAPFREFERMRREMDRFWDSFFERRANSCHQLILRRRIMNWL